MAGGRGLCAVVQLPRVERKLNGLSVARNTTTTHSMMQHDTPAYFANVEEEERQNKKAVDSRTTSPRGHHSVHNSPSKHYPNRENAYEK